ncbi:MAG: hypothetical protein AB7S99_15535 [Pseudodonghicola sp.]
MKRIELLKTLALVFFIALGAAVSHASADQASLWARATDAADRPCTHKVILVSHPHEVSGPALPRAELG